MDENAATESSGSESDEPPQDTDDSAESILADRSLFTRYIETGLGSDLQNLPVRYLAPGAVADLWRDMCANSHKVSYSSFLRVWKEFGSCLRFRQKGDFTECDVCTELKLSIKNAKREGYCSLVDATQRLHAHYQCVGRSRDLEESLRSMPPSSSKPVLFICTDGMDQSHWCIPRLRQFRGPKKLGGPGVRRPKCKCQGVWAFYHGIHMFIADTNQPHDACMTCECIARTLEQCKIISEQRGQPLPAELVVMTDNTCRENKNSCLMAYLSHLQLRGMFSSVGFIQHCKGHTHNILDQCFGVISRAFQFCDYLPDIHAVAKEIESILKRPTLRAFLAGAEVCVSVLESCRDWSKFLDKFGVSFSGGLRLDLTSNHCFLWLSRPLVFARL